MSLETVASLPLLDDCWNRIGVQGDSSCPELAMHIHCRNCPVFAAAGQTLFDREPPSDCMVEWGTALAHCDANDRDGTLPVLIFRLGEEWLALEVAVLAEIAEPRPVHRIPHRSGKLLLGLVNIRGELELCVSLRNLLGIGPSAHDPGRTAARLMVAEHQQRRWVFPADEVAGVHRIAQHELGNVPATVASGPMAYSRNVFSRDGKRVGRLDVDRVFESLTRGLG